MSGVATMASKSSQFSFYPLHHVVAADVIGARFLRFLQLLPRRDHEHRLGLAPEAVGQDDRAPDHLVGMLGVDTEADGNFHRLVELGKGVLGHRGHRLWKRVLRLDRHRVARGGELLSDATHQLLLALSRAPTCRRHVPARSRK